MNRLARRVAVVVTAASWLTAAVSDRVQAQAQSSNAGNPTAPSVSTPGPEDGVRALIVPRREAKLSSQITARILSIGPEPGAPFVKGATLVQFDCRGYQAEHRKAQAELLAASRTYENRRQLSELNSGSLLELDLAKAKELEARASLEAVLATLSECTIQAPFDGRVVNRMTNAHESVTPGTPLIEILDERDLDAKIIVPSRWLTWLKSGQALEVRIEELDISFPARVRTVGSRVDPVSQSVEVTAGLVGGGRSLKPGMSGIALFPKIAP